MYIGLCTMYTVCDIDSQAKLQSCCVTEKQSIFTYQKYELKQTDGSMSLLRFGAIDSSNISV